MVWVERRVSGDVSGPPGGVNHGGGAVEARPLACDRPALLIEEEGPRLRVAGGPAPLRRAITQTSPRNYPAPNELGRTPRFASRWNSTTFRIVQGAGRRIIGWGEGLGRDSTSGFVRRVSDGQERESDHRARTVSGSDPTDQRLAVGAESWRGTTASR
jgi:hypothetical protein